MSESQEVLLGRLKRYQSLRNVAVIVAVALIVLSLLRPNPTFALIRAFAWASAGVLCIGEGGILKKLGAPAGNSWTNALIYFAVALLPLLMRR